MNIKKLPLKIPETFYKVDKLTGCWNWLLYIKPDGYGQYTIRPNYRIRNKKISVPAHKWSYENVNGRVLPNLDLQVAHKCNNRKCINPEHLKILTKFDNITSSNVITHTDKIVAEVLRLRIKGYTYKQISTKTNVPVSSIPYIILKRKCKNPLYRAA